MADHVTIDPGATPSEIINADDCGAAGKVQGVKLCQSADGVATYVDADANGLKVQLGAALPAGANAIGKLAANSGVDIGDVDVTSCALPTGAATEATLAAVKTAVETIDNAIAGTEMQVDVASIELANGKTRISKRVALSAAQTGAAFWTPASGKKFALKKLVVSCHTGGKVQFFDGTDSGNTVIGPQLALAANGGYAENWDGDMPYVSAAADNVLKYTTDSTFVGSAYVEGWEI